MKALLIRYLNEIVALTVMALMTLALVGGQADATARQVAADDGLAVIEIRLTIDD